MFLIGIEMQIKLDFNLSSFAFVARALKQVRYLIVKMTHLNGLEKVVSQANFPELVIIKIELPADIIGREYKEGAVV